MERLNMRRRTRSRLWKQRPYRNMAIVKRWVQRRWGPEAGSSLPFALIIALVVIITGLAVASATVSGVFSSVFQQDSRRAREAAELGANRIVAELNRERNRGLLAVTPGAGGFWTQTEADANKNKCAVRVNTPSTRPSTVDLNLIRSGGVAGTFADNPIVYVADDGTRTAEADTVPDATRATNVRYAYQLVGTANTSIAVNPIAGPNPDKTSATFGQLNQVGAISMRVRGFSYNNGRLSASATIDQQLEVLPKCCGRSLAQFGNDLRSCTVGTGPGLGFLIGVGENSVGDAKLNGSGAELDNGTTPINPVVCLGTNKGDCKSTITVGSGPGSDVPVVQVPKPEGFPAVETFPTSLPPPNPLTGILTSCDKASGCSTTTIPDGSFRTRNSSTSPTTIIDVVNVTDANLPGFCKSKANDPAAGVTTVHCNLSELALDGTIEVKTSASRRLKLYFPNEGEVVSNATGKSNLVHTNTTTPPVDAQSVLQLQLFGCTEVLAPGSGCVGDASTINNQTLRLVGNTSLASSDPYFLYFPTGSVEFKGGGGVGDQFNGVLWVSTVTGTGNVQINVPGSGVSAILSQYGIIDKSGTGADKPLIWDYVTRAVRQFRLLPGS